MKAWILNRQRAREDRFVALVFPHLRQLHRVAYRLSGCTQEAEDLVQDLLLALLPRVDELDEVERLGPWLAKVLYRRFVDQYRRRCASPVDERVRLFESDAQGDSAPEWNTAADQAPCHYARLDLQRSLTVALSALPVGWRDVVMLHDVEGYTAEEVAEILALQPGTVKSRLHRARKKLRLLLGDFSLLDVAADLSASRV